MSVLLRILTVIATVQTIFASDLRNVTFWKIEDKKFVESATKEVAVFRDRYFCIHYCMSVDYCGTLSWNAKTGNCQISVHDTSHDHMIRRKMTLDPDWNGYTRPKHSVFNAQSALGRYALTFEEAVKLCESRGSHLASITDMKVAHADGLHLCECGWISNGYNVASLQRVSSSCSYSDISTPVDCNRVRADAWCRTPKCYFVGNYYKIFTGMKFAETVLLEEGTFPHYFDCINRCSDMILCESIAWNSRSKVCMLARLDVTFALTIRRYMVSDIDWMAYALIKFPVFIAWSSEGLNQLTFEEAKEECIRNDAVMASAGDVMLAKDMGMHRCSCGWITEGINVAVLKHENCSIGFTDGFETCGLYLANAWCKN